MLELREIKSNNFGEVRRHLQICWEDTYGPRLSAIGMSALVTSLESSDIAGLLPGDDEFGYAAFQGDRLVGTAVAAVRSGHCYAWGCYVAPDMQRAKIGSQLLREICQRAVREDSNCRGIIVEVLESSESAVEFYNSIGFRTFDKNQFQLAPGFSMPSLKMGATMDVMLKMDG